MNENKSLKILGTIMLITGAAINIVPELISSIFSVVVMLIGLFLIYKNGLTKKVAIISVVLNGLSLVVCGFCLLIQLSYSADNFKLGNFPMNITCYISIALTVITIVLTFLILKKRKMKND